MNKLKVLTLSSVLTVLAASCDASAAPQNQRLQAAPMRGQPLQSVSAPSPARSARIMSGIKRPE